MFSRTHLLLVAGPSGVGKTTIMEKFGRGELPLPIVRHLPDGAFAWPILKMNPPPGYKQKAPPEAVIHVDITAAYRMPQTYARALPEFKTARALTILELTSDPDQLAWRYLDREWPNRDISKADPTVTKAALLSHLVLPKTSLPADQGVIVDLARRAGMSPGAAQKLAIYRQEGWLDIVHKLWRRQLAIHCSGKKVTLVQVEMIDGRHKGDEGVFRVVAAGNYTL